jgi:molybdenum cofactor guanylyltransferase
MRRLGAIIAGGRATRFGGDKAAALLNGRALIDHVADGLRPQCDALIICGRTWPGMAAVDDRPRADMGPLGGLNAALHAAQQNGFDAVISAGCDVLPVPIFPSGDEKIYFEGHYLFGIWPVALAGLLDQHLANQSNHSMRHWIAVSGAKAILCDTRFYNLNTRDDLQRFGVRLASQN